jgi:hypothetical protein
MQCRNNVQKTRRLGLLDAVACNIELLWLLGSKHKSYKIHKVFIQALWNENVTTS